MAQIERITTYVSPEVKADFLQATQLENRTEADLARIWLTERLDEYWKEATKVKKSGNR